MVRRIDKAVTERDVRYGKPLLLRVNLNWQGTEYAGLFCSESNIS